ncbi:hypothetical protein GOB94_11850 [Granulicella sp. 5B5]|uniref:DUF7544 domain-containing protein n=1 Tax=Granulicella sp. 5B5 TaxID=1617967 RepID=UPI0015F785C2|nr:hypothetical protein [Granulicella sp. 5B5]QMV19297.1 hypothetical protein GOB94_11850 [Granulicella sp. 5B5]
MRPLSATDAISPAWNHTSTLLLAPRSWSLLLKIGAVAIFAGLGGGFSTGLPPNHGVSHLPSVSPLFAAAMLSVIIGISLLALVIGIALLYLGSRLQFVLFEVLLTRRTTIGPIWARYGSVTWRWIGLKLLFMLAALLCMAPILVPAGIYLFRNVFDASNGVHPNLSIFVPAMALSIFAIALGALVIAAIWVWLSDFGLPSIALEDTSITETVQRVLSLVRAEPGQFILYLLLRMVLSFAFTLVAEIGLAIGAVIALIPIGVGGGILWMALHSGGVIGKAVMITGWVVLAIAFLTVFVCAAIMTLGYVRSFLKTYSLYFLGGRYPRLGEYLDQYQATLPIPAPSYPQPYPPYAPPNPS